MSLNVESNSSLLCPRVGWYVLVVGGLLGLLLGWLGGSAQALAAGCPPQAMVGLDVTREDGRLRVAIRASGDSLRSLTLGAPGQPLVNAVIDVPDGSQGVTGAGPVAVPAGATSVVILVRPATAGERFAVPLVVEDGCGTHQTLVGGGPATFAPVATADPAQQREVSIRPASAGVDLTVSATDTFDPAAVNGALTYAISVTNQGSSAASDVLVSLSVIADQLGTLVDHIDTDCPGVIVPEYCELGRVEGGTMGSMYWTVKPLVAGGLSNTITVSTPETDVNPANNSTSVSTTIITSSNRANLAVTIDPPQVTGLPDYANVQYSIRVTNNGPDAATNVRLTHTSIVGYTTGMIFGGPSQGPQCTGAYTLVCQFGTISSGSSATFSYMGEGVFTREYFISAVATAFEPDQDFANNRAYAYIDAGFNELRLTGVGEPNPVQLGQDLVYTLTMTYVSGTSLTLPQIQVTLPANVTFVSHTFPAGCSGGTSAGSTFTCIPASPSLGSAVSYQVRVRPTAPGTLALTASASARELDVQPSNNSVTLTTSAYIDYGTDDLSVSISQSPNPAVVGQELIYTLTVTLIDGSAGSPTEPIARVTLPTGATQFEQGFPGICTGDFIAGGTFTCGLGNQPRGVPVPYEVHLRPTTVGSLTFTASVSSRETDIAPSNNTATVTTTVVAPIIPRITGVTVNGGALATTSRTVTVDVAATTDPGSTLTQVELSSDGVTWPTATPYGSTLSVTLPAGDGRKTVFARVRNSVGGVSEVASTTIMLDTTVATSFGVSINDAAIWTNTVNVTLSLPAVAGTAKMMISNDGGFGGATWEPYNTHKTWSLDAFEGDAVTMVVYVRFGDANGTELPSSRSLDNIILDTTPPTGSVALGNAGAGAAPVRQGENGSVSPQSPVLPLQLTATDTQSGSRMTMRLSNRADFTGAVWRPFTSSATWDFGGGGTIHAQFRDGAGNLSPIYSQTLPGSAPPGTSPTVSCSPRPPVRVNVQRRNGALVTTLTATGANNGLRAVRFDTFANAVVDAGIETGQTAPFAVSLPPGQEPTSLQFTVRRQAGNQATTVRLVVIDGCGEWSTFVGGGSGAF